MNKCVHCNKQFHNWIEYQEHESLEHWNKLLPNLNPFEQEETQENVAFATASSSGRTDLGKRPYPGPMPKDVKARIVAQGETRLGAHSFFGKGE